MKVDRELSFEEIKEIKSFLKAAGFCYICAYKPLQVRSPLYLIYNGIRYYIINLCEEHLELPPTWIESYHKLTEKEVFTYNIL